MFWAFIRHRRVLVVIVQLMLVVLSNYVALWLKWGLAIGDASAFALRTMPWLVAVRGLVFVPLRLYEGLWRYSSIWDLRNIIVGVFGSSIVFYVVMRFAVGIRYPGSVLVIDSLLLVFALGGLRLGRRLHRALGSLDRAKRVLIYGAGDAGEMIVRDMRNDGSHGYTPIGFVDDDPRKAGQRIHGIEVLGGRDALPAIMRREAPDAVLVAMPSAAPPAIRAIVRALGPYKVPIQTMPSLRDVLGGRVSVRQVRALGVEDLLYRAPVDLDADSAGRLIRGRRVMVTGAGGSIGSELSRQIAALGPSRLLLLDRYESGLHGLCLDLNGPAARCRPQAMIGDVGDAARITALLGEHRPEILFHAAAHKHVPLMEANPCEAVKNNVRGTRILAEAAAASGVERFVLISTDKAVNPTSVMGATKRLAELVVGGIGRGSPGTFAAVRFGNVLASNGSVVPQFMAQIEAGGPVTVTHPEVRRYFMLVSEAVHLVLQAAALAEGDEIFVLEMGEQLRVVDLARNMIRLAGYVPDEEIGIEFVGLRPGEKLSEELTGKDETAEPTAASSVLRVQPGWRPEWPGLAREVRELERVAADGAPEAVLERLRALVPTYRPWSPES